MGEIAKNLKASKKFLKKIKEMSEEKEIQKEKDVFEMTAECREV